MVFHPLAIEFATTVVGIVTAVGTLFTSVALVITAVVSIRRVGSVETAVKEVHVIVNQQRTDLLNYQKALVRALQTAGIEVPMDQSQPPDNSAPGNVA